MFKNATVAAIIFSAAAVSAQTVVDVTGVGREKIPVQINVANQAFAKSLKKNLEISGLFAVKQQGAIKVSGASGAVTAVGNGKQVSSVLLLLTRSVILRTHLVLRSIYGTFSF